MSLKHGLLGLLNYGEMTGYELNKAFEESLSFFWQAQTSQIYRELNKMEEIGWLTSRIQFQTDRPNRRIYSITEAGRAEILEWLKQDITASVRPERSALLLKLFFSANAEKNIGLEMLRAVKAVCEQCLAEMNEVNETMSKYGDVVGSSKEVMHWAMTADYGRRYYKMTADWASDCIAMMEGFDEEGIDH